MAPPEHARAHAGRVGPGASPLQLVHVHAAIDVHFGARDVARAGRCQERDRMGDVLRLAEAGRDGALDPAGIAAAALRAEPAGARG